MADKPTTPKVKGEKSQTRTKRQPSRNKKTKENGGKGGRPVPGTGTAPDQGKIGQGSPDADFPIVGIGASAGGLEAFEQFFTHMPPDADIAFVLVQHLDPTHKSILSDLLRSFTRMVVREVRDGMKVEPNSIYVIPPNADMAILRGHLHLMEPSAPRGMRQPIDFFFRSLSEDRKEHGICMVLSGSGTEGTVGLREIKGQGGMVMVQDPATAKYDGMPKSAIATGLVDYILPPDKMAEQLMSYVRHPFTKDRGVVPEVEPDATNWLQKILILIRARTTHDFSLYKQSTIVRRVERRMAIHEIADFPTYLRYLQTYPDEVDTLFKELLIGVTNFFRDADAFEFLKKKVIPSIMKGKAHGEGSVRVWVPGCSTGEEAYSLAILFQEQMEQTRDEIKVQIFATDIDSAAIETARTGLYPHGIAVDVQPDRLRRFFAKQDGAYRVRKKVRDMVVFAVQNVITDPPFSKIDLVSCRNLLIYMGSELQKRILPIFHYSLSKGGHLLLGTSETVGEFSSLFTPVERKWKIFRRKDAETGGLIPVDLAPHAMNRHLMASPDRADARQVIRLTNQALVERSLLDTYAASGILINEQGDILYFHGATGRYLTPPEGEAKFNAVAMARDGLKIELANAIRKASLAKEEVRYEHVRVKTNGQDSVITLIVKPIWDPPSKRGLYLVIFEEIREGHLAQGGRSSHDRRRAGADARVKQLEHDLASTKEYLQTTIEELETSNEELKSTNEELQSANEELQSTNEELETSKEEQQSVNEELVTVNSELQQKIDALSKANDDMTNLLSATEIGTVFLDTHLNIQRFTPTVKKIINLIDSDVGRPIQHIVHNLLHYETLIRDAQEVLHTLGSKEAEVQTTSGNWYSMRILPYRTVHNVIEGIVVTFVDINDRKQAMTKLEESEERYRSIGELIAGIWNCSPDGRLTYMSKRFLSRMGMTEEDVQEFRWIQQMKLEGAEKLLSDWENCIVKDRVWSHRYSIQDKSGKKRDLLARAAPVKGEDGHVKSWVGISLDLADVAEECGS
jgi:two-component system CheB/CheR fusion protein